MASPLARTLPPAVLLGGGAIAVSVARCLANVGRFYLCPGRRHRGPSPPFDALHHGLVLTTITRSPTAQMPRVWQSRILRALLV
jgi:hypothetical protein